MDDPKREISRDDFVPRHSITRTRNGKPFSGYVSINVAVWKAVLGLLGAFIALLAGVAKTVEGSFDVFARPTIEAIARQQAEPIAQTLAVHVVESQRAHETFLSRIEGEKLRSEDRQALQEMKEQVEFLYRNEIRKAGGR